MATTTTGDISSIQATNNPSKAQTAQVRLGADLNTFLKLLTTQLKNQDPTSPLDTSQFTQQLASLSQVEQSIDTNSNLEKLIAATSSKTITDTVGYIGKTVDVSPGNQGVLTNGASSFAYELPAGTVSAQVVLTNQQGETVFSGNGPTRVGKNVVTWAGTNSFNGKTEPAGMYTLSVVAKDAAGKNVTVKTYTSGPVDAVEIQNGSPVLAVGTLKVPVDQVTAIRNNL